MKNTSPVQLRFLNHNALEIKRLDHHRDRYPEIKDPSVIKETSEQYTMYASIGSSISQDWIVGRFQATHPDGPWSELAPVQFQDLSGSQLCAPAVRFEDVDGQPTWSMYIQTSCFDENGYIAFATSRDGQHFIGRPTPLMSVEMLDNPPHKIVGLYDAGISEIQLGGEQYFCLLFSGYRRVGCGDIYMSIRRKADSEESWSKPMCVMTQEEVPFHNRPDYEWFEWGLEGAQLIQLKDNSFLLVAVCFTPKPAGNIGTRQRVFFAHAHSLSEKFLPLITPLEPAEINGKRGENGHPDMVIEGEQLHFIYQERLGEGDWWHLREIRFDKEFLQTYLLELRKRIIGNPGLLLPNYSTHHEQQHLQQ